MKKSTRIVMTALSAVVIPLSAHSATVEVDCVSALTNAFANAQAGDEIVLLKRGSPYVFTDEYMYIDEINNKDGSITPVTNLLAVGVNNLLIRGEDDAPRKDWADHSEPVVVDGNGKGRILFVKKNCTGTKVMHLTFTGARPGETSACSGGAVYTKSQNAAHLTLSNCVFRQNHAYEYSAGGYATLRDCCVTNNTCSNRNAFRGTAYASDFIDNRPSASEKSYFYDCRFIGNYRDGGGACGSGIYVLSNCFATANTGGYCFDVSGITSSMYDCVFSNNVVDLSVLLNPLLVKGCRIVDNICQNNRQSCAIKFNRTCNALIADCDFTGNVSGHSGGAIALARTSSQFPAVTVTNCMFTRNSAAAEGGAIFNDTSNLPDGETAWDYITVYDSVFENNAATYSAGVSGVHAVRCVFKDNFRFNIEASLNKYGCDASSSYLEGCDISGGELANCVVVGSELHDITNTVNCVFREYTRVTNSIIRNCRLNEYERSMYLARTTLDAEFVNCTFVTNSMNTYSIFGDIVTTNGMRFVNCVFNSNRNNELESDITAFSRAGWALWSGFEFVNTYYGAFEESYYLTEEMFATKTAGAGSLMRCASPKFAGEDPAVAARYPDEPYWALSYRSPLAGGGHVFDWPDGAVDVAGRPRVRDGKVDVGCYQCWMVPPGTVISVK